jgi:hypothetical protein
MKKELTDKEIEALQNKKRQERINLCSKEIQEVLDKHECIIEAEVLIGMNKVAPMIKVLSKK